MATVYQKCRANIRPCAGRLRLDFSVEMDNVPVSLILACGQACLHRLDMAYSQPRKEVSTVEWTMPDFEEVRMDAEVSMYILISE